MKIANEYLDQLYTEIRRSDAVLTKEEYDKDVLTHTKSEQAAYDGYVKSLKQARQRLDHKGLRERK